MTHTGNEPPEHRPERSGEPQTVLVVGNGGREHAICRALATADPAPRVLVCPGNPGTQSCAENVPAPGHHVDAVVELAKARAVDLVIPGPEQPLVDGLADALNREKIPCCGPSAAAARLEGSKHFCRELGARVGVPGARFALARTPHELRSALEQMRDLPHVPVVKADGLAAGKGVFLPDTFEDCLRVGTQLLEGSLGAAGVQVLVEERMVGIEASLFFACSGTPAVALPHAQDHKRLGNGDTGPNTGGMGAISPNPVISEAIEDRARTHIVEPVLAALQDAGTPFVGFLFAGLMLTQEGPKLLEFNVRLGDPEAQVILPRLADAELLTLAHAAAHAELRSGRAQRRPETCCGVVLASAGYPSSSSHGDAIEVDDDLETADRWLIHAGTARSGDQLRTAGGRVATVVARASDAASARRLAYEGVEHVRFAGRQARTDIGSTVTGPAES